MYYLGRRHYFKSWNKLHYSQPGQSSFMGCMRKEEFRPIRGHSPCLMWVVQSTNSIRCPADITKCKVSNTGSSHSIGAISFFVCAGVMDVKGTLIDDIPGA